MELVIVHLTDIHIQDDQDFDVIFDRITSLGGAICNHITDPDITAVLMCVTGDLAFSGQENQYTSISLLLEEICSIIRKRFSKVGIYPVFVPGNHDCDFQDEKEKVREALLDSPTLDIADPSLLKACTEIQKNYFSFVSEWEKNYNAMSCKPDRILTVNELNLNQGEINIKFHCFNTSWCSRCHEEKGKMKIVNGKMNMPSDCLKDKEENDIVITMMHHDAEWMDWEDKEVWNAYHKKYSDIILVGHDHTTEFVLKQNYDESSNYFVKGNQLYDKKTPEQSGFNILKINTEYSPIKECFFSYEWNGSVYKRIIDTRYHTFNKNRFLSSGIELKKEVWDFLEKMDIDIACGTRKELKLSDIFGFPTLKEEKGKVTQFFREMSSLIEYLEKVKYVSIRGQKEYGKTALLKQMFEQFYKMKKFPIFLDIARINTADGEALNAIIEKSYCNTYNNIDVNAIMQKAAEERICFIDNFEEIRLGDKNAKKLLKYLTNKFGYIVMTKNHTLDILNPLNYVEMNDYIEEKFHILVIQPTRQTSKERIINKWIQLSGKTEIDTVTFDAKKKEKYRQIQTVMKSNYFNKTPMDLLLVLSYLEEDHPAQLDYSRYSYVYDSLILKKLTAIAESEKGRISNNISMYKAIIQKLAYRMYSEGKQGYVKEEYVLEVILDYKEHHSNTKLKATSVIEKLVNYQFLECKEDTYKFKHRYIYYYFVGSYIEEALPPDKKDQVICRVFQNIDDSVNYNVALFLAYKMNIEYEIIPLVKKYGEPLLQQYCEFKYDNIRKCLEEWSGDIEKKVDRVYSVPQNEEIPQIREKELVKLEEMEEESENSTRDAEVKRINGDVLKLGRYIDFMGNILKNYSGKMENEQREDGIDFIFKSVSKVIGSLCNFSMDMVDKIIQMIEEKIKDGDKENIEFKSQFTATIEDVFAQILFNFIEANLMVLSVTIDSDTLKENIATYCAAHDSEFVKMANLEYLIRISSVRLPVDEISELFTGKGSLSEISQKILKDNIYRYLTSYQYDRHDRQVVCSILGFNSKDLLIQEKKLAMLAEK